MRVAILMAAVLHAAFAAPQFDFLTLKDGKIGVNFGGYHASAGLGGLLTGNAAHGGLSASAGTPYGQNAAAGLGGSTAGNPRGFLYANANANPSVGASAGLGGEAGVSGYGGSEAHVNGIATSKNLHAPVAAEVYGQEIPPPVSYEHVNSIQKIKPPKKYSQSYADYNVVHSKVHTKTATKSLISPRFGDDVEAPAQDSGIGVQHQYEITKTIHSPIVVQRALDIPIGILQVIQNAFRL